MPIKIKDGQKLCRTCNSRKPRNLFSPIMHQTCMSCLRGRTPEEFREDQRKLKNKKREVYRKKAKEILRQDLGDYQAKRGFIYLLYSKSKKFYKIGVGLDPVKRARDIRNTDYKIKDLELLAFSTPIGDAFQTENWIHRKLKKYQVYYKKPCGGKAKELFNCSKELVLKYFIGCSQDIKIMKGSFFKKINVDKTPKLNISLKSKKNSLLAKSILREFRRSRKKNIFNEWSLFMSVNCQRLRCYATGDRNDHLFESVFDKDNKCISLGLFTCPEKAVQASREFGDFLKSEKRNIRKKYVKLVHSLYKYWDYYKFYGGDDIKYVNEFLTYVGFFRSKKWGCFSDRKYGIAKVLEGSLSYD